MILEWAFQTPTLLASLVVVFFPGLVAMYGVGLRGLSLLAAAPLFSVALTALVAVVFGAVGIEWSLLSWAIATVLLVGIAWLVGRLLGPHLPHHVNTARQWYLPTALVIGSMIGIWRLTAYIGDPAGISQTNDAVFHMNAVRFILETFDASSMHVNAVVGGASFYPAAWHGLVSLVVMMTGASIATAANALTLVIGAFIWPIGIAWLTRAVTGSNLSASYAAVLSSALQTFPLLMFQWGVLFPNALSIALIPAAIALVVSLPEWSAGTARWQSALRALLMLLVVTTALTLSQPSALVPWAAITVTWFTFWVLSRVAFLGWARSVLLVGGSWVVLACAWLFLASSTSGSHWPPSRGKFESFRDVVLNGQVLIPPAYGVSILMIVGVIIAFRRARLRWFAVAWVGVSGLYLLVAGISAPWVRDGILGAWYADPYRISALAPIVVIPLAAVGFDVLLRTAVRWFDRGAVDARVAGIGLAVVTAFMVVLVVIRPVAMPDYLRGTFDRESRYSASDDAYLDPDERTLLESLDGLVDSDSRVLGNPSTGSGFGYFLSGVDVFPRNWAPPTSEEWSVLGQRLRDAADDPDVCEAVRLYGAEYVLDFGPGEETPGRYKMPGLTEFEGQEGFELVAEEGEASLWRITACSQ